MWTSLTESDSVIHFLVMPFSQCCPLSVLIIATSTSFTVEFLSAEACFMVVSPSALTLTSGFCAWRSSGFYYICTPQVGRGSRIWWVQQLSALLWDAKNWSHPAKLHLPSHGQLALHQQICTLSSCPAGLKRNVPAAIIPVTAPWPLVQCDPLGKAWAFINSSHRLWVGPNSGFLSSNTRQSSSDTWDACPYSQGQQSC